MEQKEKVLEVKDLVISFKTDRGIVRAVRGVSFDLYKGETLCLVGESGSGKSVTNKSIMGISSKNAIIENGSILYEGEDLLRVSEEEFHRIRGHKIGMIFQDPLSALNPVMRIGKQIIEATMINKNIFKKKFAEYTSAELTLYRNNEADYNYSVKQIDNELNKIFNLRDEYAATLKAVNKAKIDVDKATNNEKKEGLSKLVDELEKKVSDLYTSYEEYVRSLKKKTKLEIESYNEAIKKYEANKPTEHLLEAINRHALEKVKRLLEFIKQPKYLNFNDNLVESLKSREEVLKEFKLIHKEEFKKCNPALKENYKVAKGKAKIAVASYKRDIKYHHQLKIRQINADIFERRAALENYSKSLSPDLVSRIEQIIEFNKNLKAKRDKAAKQFKENSISKVVKNTEEFKEIPDKKYEELYNKINESYEELIKEKEDYISKTVITKAEAKKMALEVMKEVGIPMPEKRFKQYPFEFSGGMRQRIVIAIALTANPEILICDEPTTALDVTIQAQILELINRLKKERNLSCIFITHDLGVVANMADRVAVMYAGKIVEYGNAEEVFFEPKHPYTWALLSSIPDVDSKEKLEAIPGTPPDMIYPPKGDAFALRSKYAMEIDFKNEPPYFEVSPTHYAATWLLHPDAPKVEMPKIVAERIKNALKNGGKTNE